MISILGILFSFIAQLQMRTSWRIAIDESRPVRLVKSGLFAHSRNPIYLGLTIAFIGFFLIAPNAGSILFLLVMYIGIQKKIVDEEKFLKREIPQEYLPYKSAVRRWI